MPLELNRYNVVIRLSANLGTQANSPESIKATVEALLGREPFLKIGAMKFVIESAKVTGVFDKDWNEIEL